MEASMMQQRLEEIAAFVKTHQQQAGETASVPAQYIEYRWLHTLRVANLGLRLAKAEGADIETCLAACLLHDIASFDPGEPSNHGRLGAQISRPFLQQLGYPSPVIDNICCAVAAHVDNDPGFEHPVTSEVRIVIDADNLDRFDGYRLVEYCLPHMSGFFELTGVLRDRIARLEHYRREQVMQTRTGNELMNPRLDLQIAVYRAIVEQEAISEMPKVEV
jgi:HD superfamily phosphodiesterase